MIVGRRGFLAGLGAAFAAPAIVNFQSLMPVKVMAPVPPPNLYIGKVPRLSVLREHGWVDIGAIEEFTHNVDLVPLMSRSGRVVMHRAAKQTATIRLSEVENVMWMVTEPANEYRATMIDGTEVQFDGKVMAERFQCAPDTLMKYEVEIAMEPGGDGEFPLLSRNRA